MPHLLIIKYKIMANLKINEAIAFATMNGKKINKTAIAARLWPDSTPLTRRQNMTNLCTGKTDKINPRWVDVICEMTGCDANFLFNVKTNEQ